jgi:hypothetical protein
MASFLQRFAPGVVGSKSPLINGLRCGAIAHPTWTRSRAFPEPLPPPSHLRIRLRTLVARLPGDAKGPAILLPRRFRRQLVLRGLEAFE